ncbi:hypothetical protein ACFQX6_39250 [Streptosporangium lutulentum]
MLLALVGAAVAAVMLVVATPDLEPPGAGAGVSPGPAGSLPSPTPVAGTGAVTAPEKNPDEDEEGFEERLAAGRALPLKIGQATRDKLVAASRAAAYLPRSQRGWPTGESSTTGWSTAKARRPTPTTWSRRWTGCTSGHARDAATGVSEATTTRGSARRPFPSRCMPRGG